MHGRDGDIAALQAEDITWVRASLSVLPPWHYKQLTTVEAIEAIIPEDTTDMEHTMVWARINES